MALKYIFGVEDVITKLGLGPLIVGEATIEPQTFSPQIGQSVAAALGNFGEILLDGASVQATQEFDIKQTFSFTVCTNVDANAGVTVILGGAGATMLVPYNTAVSAGPPPVNYGLYSKVVLTGVSLSQPAAGFGKLSFNAHAHFFHAATGPARDHVGGAFTIALPTFGWGIQQRPICIAASTQILDVSKFNGYNYDAQVGHEDELDRSGRFLIGASHTCQIKESFGLVNYNDGTDLTTAIQGSVIAMAANWKMTSQARGPANTGYETLNISAETYQNLDP